MIQNFFLALVKQVLPATPEKQAELIRNLTENIEEV